MKSKIRLTLIISLCCILVGCNNSSSIRQEGLKEEREYYQEIQQAYDELLSNAKYPTSIKIKECIVNHMIIKEEKIDTYYVYFDIEGKNALGNEIEEYCEYTHDCKFGSVIFENVLYDDFMEIRDEATGNVDDKWEEISDTHHKHEFESIAYQGTIFQETFIVNWKDFENYNQ